MKVITADRYFMYDTSKCQHLWCGSSRISNFVKNHLVAHLSIYATTSDSSVRADGGIKSRRDPWCLRKSYIKKDNMAEWWWPLIKKNLYTCICFQIMGYNVPELFFRTSPKGSHYCNGYILAIVGLWWKSSMLFVIVTHTEWHGTFTVLGFISNYSEIKFGTIWYSRWPPWPLCKPSLLYRMRPQVDPK